MHHIKTGIKGSVSTIVKLSLAASSVGSGLLDVYSTPSMIALMEEAAASAIASFLEEGNTSVGTSVDIKHIAATPLEESVTAFAEVIEVAGNRIVFAVEVHDEQQLIGKGTHVRYVVEADEFLKNIVAVRKNQK